MIHGESLSPLLRGGTEVAMRPLYCVEKVRRGDLVVFRTGAREQAVIKIAKAIPGDRFTLDMAGLITVNGAALKNSAGVPYRLPSSARTLLQSYERAYGGVIPADTYLLIGDGVNGGTDSTRLGLLHISDFIMVGASP